LNEDQIAAKLKRNRMRKFTCPSCAAIIYHTGFLPKAKCLACNVAMNYADPRTVGQSAPALESPGQGFEEPAVTNRSIPLENLGLSTRASNALKRRGFKTVGDLIDSSENELMALPNFGRGCLQEVQELIRQYGGDGTYSVPPFAPYCAIADLGLSRRSTNALWNAGFRYYEEIRELAPHELGALWSMGSTSVDEIVTLIVQRGEVMGLVSAHEFASMFEVPHIEEQPHCGLARLEIQPELRTKLGALGASCVCRICSYTYPQLLRLLNFQVAEATEVVRALEKAGHTLLGRARDIVPKSASPERMKALETHPPPERSLDEELWLLTEPAGTEDNRLRAAAYFGWDGSCGATLQEVANRLGGLSRQRVQQATRRVESRAASIPGFFVHLGRALEAIGDAVPCATSDAERMLVESGIAERRLSVEGILRAARLRQLAPNFELWPENDRIIVAAGTAAATSAFVRCTKKAVAHHGVVTIAEVCAANANGFDDVGARLVLSSVSTFEWLAEDDGWFWFSDVRNNRLVNQIQKCLTAAPKLLLAELRQALSRHPELRGYAPPRVVLASLCSRLPFCRVDTDFVVRSAAKTGDPLTDCEKAYLDLFATAGPVLSRPVIESQLAGRFTLPTLTVVLQHSPVVKKFAYNTYGVVGAQHVDLSPTTNISIKQSTIDDYGWGDNGGLWIKYRVSRAMLGSGIITIPAAVRSFLTGEFQVRDEDAVDLGTLKIGDGGSAWGLRTFFARRGGEADDTLHTTFDLSRRTVTVSMTDDWQPRRDILKDS
jgi:hypothetical protein